MTRTRLTKNFYRDEFACKCGCGLDTVDQQLVEGLQLLRDIVGEPITVNSGCRCEAHNAAVGGSPDSQHLIGRAADIVINGYHPTRVASFAGNLPQFQNGGIGVYGSFTHLDSRSGGRSRWEM